MPKVLIKKPRATPKPRTINLLSLLRSKSTPQTKYELEKQHNQKMLETMKGAML